MTNEQRKAIELAKEFMEMDFSNPMGWSGYYDTDLKELSKAIDTVLSLIKEQQIYIKKYNDTTEEMNRDIRKLISEIQKKDKQIDLMVEYIDKIDVSEDICEGKTMCDENCKDCIKQYFERKVEEC